jgi:hypothetical protein
MRAAVAKLDPNLSLSGLMTADRSTELIAAQMYLCQRLSSVFALFGLLLAGLVDSLHWRIPRGRYRK